MVFESPRDESFLFARKGGKNNRKTKGLEKSLVRRRRLAELRERKPHPEEDILKGRVYMGGN